MPVTYLPTDEKAEVHKYVMKDQREYEEKKRKKEKEKEKQGKIVAAKRLS
jgi:hypothetical protein